MSEDLKSKIVFYAVGRKFLETEKSPPKSAQLMYYSLAIGHHVGVIDCLEEKLTCPTNGYMGLIEHLDEGSEARFKLENVLKFNEITINASHIDMVAIALDKAMPKMTEQQQEWAKEIIRLCGTIKIEPAIYLTVRKIDD